MKRRLAAGFIAAMMAMSGFVVPTYARYTAENSTYEYIWTEDLKATVDEGNGKVVLTWPAVDTEGNILNANHLTADGQVNSNGCPTAGWTNPTSGMIIVYNNWSPDPALNNVKNDSKTTHEVIKGLVDTETEWPVVVNDGKTGEFVKNAYIDTTVVATSLATAYQIQISEDGGATWKEDHIASTINHGKKLTRPDGTTDSKNTFFLEDQITEAITSSLKPNTLYKIRVNAYDASTAATKSTPFKVFETEITTPAEAEYAPAFPSVEGGGKYSQGGRGSEKVQGDVYVVTNLTDSVSDPQPGSLRYGLERRDRADGNKTYPRTIVFAVGGTINVDPAAAKSERRLNINSNTTIAGQTAPGDGITIAGASVKFNGTNIISRYIRFRLGSGYDLDGGSASGENIVIDHCTFSYGVDEVFSAKELVSSSIQYNIIDSGLSIPDKDGVNNIDAELGADSARHGMGSIMNGYESSFTHNLWSNNGTRNPRFEGGFSYNNVSYSNKLDFANNVVYNWGHGSGYGGDRGEAVVNFENNYFKAGPNTLAKVKNQFFDCDTDSKYKFVKSSYFIGGNILEGNDEVNADNTKGFIELGLHGLQLDKKVELKNPYELETAEKAYENVLDNVGASFHRDAWDARLIEQVKNNTGYFVNDQNEAGGFNTEEFAFDPSDPEHIDSDMDGIPDKYETVLGLDPSDGTDSTKIIKDGADAGYSYLESYIFSLTGESERLPKTLESTAPELSPKIVSVKDSQGSELDTSVNIDLIKDEQYTLETNITDEATEIEVYLNEKLVATGKGGSAISFSADTLGNTNLMVKAKKNGYSILSDRIRTTVVNAAAAQKASTATLGDVNCDGSVKADDSAILLQYVLNKASVDISSQGFINAQVKDGTIDASFAAEILQKALVSTYKFSNEKDETAVDENAGANLEGFTSAEVGSTRAPGYDFYDPETNTLITEGNGYIGRTGSSGSASSIGIDEGYHYNYKQISGDVTMTAKIYNWAKIDYYQFSGLMITGDLSGTGEQYSSGMTYLKDEDFEGTKSISGAERFEGRNIVSNIRSVAGAHNSSFRSQYLGIPQARAGEEQIGGWAKIVKEGQKVTTYGSLDGQTWYQIFTWDSTLPEKYYIGFATSSAQDTMDLVTYNKSKITDIDIQYSAVYPS